VGKREGRRNGESNFKMDLKGMECERMDYSLWQATDVSALIVKIQEYTNKCTLYNIKFFTFTTLEIQHASTLYCRSSSIRVH
jgi:hypothetical protein